MYLTSLAAFGFKSFAQKLELPFGRGITCVVGPNGCGKSNVVDALRWAIGEQRPRVLRSHQMEDVIFSGSRTRKPLGMAEVSVTLDNSARVLPVEFSEVTVTRRLFRSGESDYLLNKIPCLLRDIQDLFMDTGLGAHAYSVIEQGMVEEIISDKPEERRRLFEEAAGVTRYKVRRRSAWNKLHSIQQDLQRIEDIIGEVGRYVRSLARQERKARLYKRYSDDLQKLEVELARYRYFEMAGRSRPMLDEMSFLKDDVEAGSTDIARLEARQEELRAELAEQDQALSLANAELSRQIETVHRKDREILVSREEIRGIGAFLERAGRQVSDLSTRRRNSAGRREAALAEISQAEETLQRSREGLHGDVEVLQGLAEDLAARRAKVGEGRALLVQTLRGISGTSGQRERARAELEGAVQRQERLREDTERAGTRRREAEDARDRCDDQFAVLERQLEERASGREARVAERKRREEEHGRMTSESVRLNARLEADGARLGLLKKLRDGFEGYSRGVRTLASDSPFTESIRGIAADTIEVDPAHATAIEAALGRAVECLLVDTTSRALDAIEHLRAENRGRAAFLPADRVSGASGAPRPLPEGDGVVGWASSLVRCPGDPTGALRSLLRNTLVVADAEAALRVIPAMRAFGADVATLYGDVFASDGTVYGGSAADTETGLVGRVQEIERLEAQIETARGDLKAVQAGIDRVEEALAEETARIEADDRALGDLQNRLTALRRDRENLQTEAGRQSATATELEGEAARLAQREGELKNTVARLESQLEETEAARRRLEEEAIEADAALRQREQDWETRQEAVSAQRVEAASLREREENLRQEVARLEREGEDLAREQTQLESECAQCEERKAHLEEVVRTASEELEQLHRTQTDLEGVRDRQAERHQELVTSVRGLEEAAREKTRRVGQSRERLHALEVELAELRTRAEELHARIRHDHDVDIKELGKLEDPEFGADMAEARIQELQERLRKMGSVNLMALEEYDVQKERYEFFVEQRDDLLESERTLKRTISRIDRTARGRFLDTFSRIRENFHRTFTEFFKGGEADLLMSPDEDPLEAPILVIARPRGKRLQNINLLSGGERALTAIALLFAIYLVKPSPFCILDEVDAALDDANIDRFVRVIQKFAEDTQFVVVTHNKRTMEAADDLHGITMEEAGVSRLVSVRFREEDGDGNGHVDAVLEATSAGVPVQND